VVTIPNFLLYGGARLGNLSTEELFAKFCVSLACSRCDVSDSVTR
jgi:hypothetical protein